MSILITEPAIISAIIGTPPTDDALDMYVVGLVNWNHIAPDGYTLRPSVTTNEVYQILADGTEVLISQSHDAQTATDGVSFTFPNSSQYRIDSKGEYTSSETWELSRTITVGINNLSIDLSNRTGGLRYRIFGTLEAGEAIGDLRFQVHRTPGVPGALESATSVTTHTLSASNGYPQSYEFRVVLAVDNSQSSLEIQSDSGIWFVRHTIENVPVVLPDQEHIDTVVEAAALPPSDYVQQDVAWLELESTLPDVSSRNNASQNALLTEIWKDFGFSTWVALQSSGTEAQWLQGWTSYLSWLDGNPDYPFPYTGDPWPWGWGWSGYFTSFLSFRGWLLNVPSIYGHLVFAQM